LHNLYLLHTVAVASIKEVRPGRGTDSFKASKDTHSEDVCFSIIYLVGTVYKTLDLAAVTVADRTAWFQSLTLLIKQSGMLYIYIYSAE